MYKRTLYLMFISLLDKLNYILKISQHNDKFEYFYWYCLCFLNWIETFLEKFKVMAEFILLFCFPFKFAEGYLAWIYDIENLTINVATTQLFNLRDLYLITNDINKYLDYVDFDNYLIPKASCLSTVVILNEKRSTFHPSDRSFISLTSLTPLLIW